MSQDIEATIDQRPINATIGEDIQVDVNGAIVQINGSSTWGSITGTLSDQTDLQTVFDNKVEKTGDTINGVFQNSTTPKTQIILNGTNAGDNADGTPNFNSSPRIELSTYQISNYTSGEAQKGGFSELIRLVSGDTQAKPTLAFYDHNYKPIAWLVSHFQPQDLRIYANLASFPVTGVDDGLRAYFAQDTGKYYTWNGSGYTELTTANSQYYYRAIHQHISIETADTDGVSNYTRLAVPYGLDVVPITTSNAHFRVTEGTHNNKPFGAFIVDSGKMFSYNDIILYPDSNNASSVETWKDGITDNIFTNNTKGVRFRLLPAGNADNIVSGQEILAMNVQGLNWLGINENVVIGGNTAYSLGINRSAGVTLDVRRDLGTANNTNYVIQRLSRTDGAFLEFGYIGNGTDLDNFLIRAGSGKGLVIGTTSNPRGFIFNNAGNLGIGNSNPGARIHSEISTDSNAILARNTNVAGNYGANVLLQTQTTGSRVIQAGLQSDTVNRLSIEASGRIEWGAGGSTARDTNLYRSAADTLRTDDNFIAGGTITGSNLSGTNTGDQNTFSTIAVAGQSNVVADSTSDTLTLVAGSNITLTTNSTNDSITIASTGSGSTAETFETVSKNLKAYPASFNYTSGVLTSIVYTIPAGTITKTLNYTSGTLTSIVLSGDTPAGIDLTKTLGYTGDTLTSITYS